MDEQRTGCQGASGRQAASMIPTPQFSSPKFNGPACYQKMQVEWQSNGSSSGLRTRQTAATARRTDATRNRSAVGTWVYVSTRHVSLRDCISYVIWEGGRCIRVSAADLHGCAAAKLLYAIVIQIQLRECLSNCDLFQLMWLDIIHDYGFKI